MMKKIIPSRTDKLFLLSTCLSCMIVLQTSSAFSVPNHGRSSISKILSPHSSSKSSSLSPSLRSLNNNNNNYNKLMIHFSTSPNNGGDQENPISVKLNQALKEGNLLNAIQVFKQQINDKNSNSKINLTKEQWNKIFAVIEERTANAEENAISTAADTGAFSQTKAISTTEYPIESAARSEMTEMYKALKDSKQLSLYGAVDARMPLAAGEKIVPPNLLESILNMPMTALAPNSNNYVLIAGVVFAILEGIVSLIAGVPLGNLVFSTILLVLLDQLLVNGAIFESFMKLLNPGVQEKILRHEAGHFLTAYLLGCPVEGIVLSAWDALKDRRFGSRQVTAGTSFFDPELSQQINTKGKVTRSTIDRYSIIVMGGIAAEADMYGRADGGAGDEMALITFLSQLNQGKFSSWNADAIRNQARWGALQAVLMIREYKPAYEALVKALERDASLGECIYAIEQAAKEHNLKTNLEPLGYITPQQTWTKENPNPGATLEPVMATAAVETKSQQVWDEESSLATLREYREELERKLQEVEQKLSENNKN